MLKNPKPANLEQVRRFLDGTQSFDLELPCRKDVYRWIGEELGRFKYHALGKRDKGTVKRYLGRATGLSRSQVTKLIAQHRDTGGLRDRRGPPAKPFASRYTKEDMRALAVLDQLHGTLSGPATRKLCQRAAHVFGDKRYLRLAGISSSHIYNLRRSVPYKRSRGRILEKTRPANNCIGERRKPRANGRPGYLRVDTVHQGDLDGRKGVYHINMVDEVTQYQFVGTVKVISERGLLPVLEGLLESFPFKVYGFHSDNGSEYVNHQTAKLLNKLNIREFTKSRARHSNDNALVESKNGSIVRKHLGYMHIPAYRAELLNEFNQKVLSPYLNYHRPCHFPVEVADSKGRIRKSYPHDMMDTPYEKLKSLPGAERHLRDGLTFAELDRMAYAVSDSEAAAELNRRRAEVFNIVYKNRRTEVA